MLKSRVNRGAREPGAGSRRRTSVQAPRLLEALAEALGQGFEPAAQARHVVRQSGEAVLEARRKQC